MRFTGALRISAVVQIPKHRQPLFQAQLKPIAAGDAIACPIVKIFMRDDRFDQFEICVRCNFIVGQNVGAVENIQSLVFHRPHIEIITGINVEIVLVIFATIDTFIPVH